MTTIYKLTRDLSGERDLIHLSTDRKLLADLMRADIDKWTVPVTYTIEITLDFNGLFLEAEIGGRISAFQEAGKLLDKLADDYSIGTVIHSAYRHATCKMFALMEQETSP